MWGTGCSVGSYGHFVRLRSAGAVEAAKQGAVATLIRSIGTDSHRIPHTGNMSYAETIAALSIPTPINYGSRQEARRFV